MTETHDTFNMWHGSKRWDGSPEIRKPKSGRYESGPGIYFTTNYSTARKYAKGGGSVMLAEISKDIGLAEKILIPINDVIEFINRTRMSHKRDIIEDVRNNASRYNRDSIAANVLINLVVSYDAGGGNAGLSVVRFLTEHGVDASLEDKSNGEKWLIVINPRIIKSIKKIPAKDINNF